MEKITEYINLKKFTHELYCDDCEVPLKDNNIVLATYPPQYSYSCPYCRKTKTTTRTYPWTEIVGDEVYVEYV